MLFVGWHELTIDAKQRLAVPSEIRSQLGASGDGQTDGQSGGGGESGGLYAVIQEGPTLSLYTVAGFEKRAEQLEASPRPPEEVLAYEQMFYALASRVELDKQGRVRLPERLLRIAGLARDVVMIGVKDHLQIHDRTAWEAKVADNLANRPELLMNPRRVIGPRETK